MTAEPDLLPLPEAMIKSYQTDSTMRTMTLHSYCASDMRDYARANVEHHTAALQAEVETLRAEVAEWKRVAVAQAELQGEAEERAERLAEALRRYRNEVPLGHQPHMLAHEVDDLLREEEARNG